MNTDHDDLARERADAERDASDTDAFAREAAGAYDDDEPVDFCGTCGEPLQHIDDRWEHVEVVAGVECADLRGDAPIVRVDPEWEVDVSFDVDDADGWKRGNDAVIGLAGDYPDASGTGFGRRDMQYVFGTRPEAEAFAAKVDAAGLDLADMSVSVYPVAYPVTS